MGFFGFGKPKQNSLKENLSGFQDTYNNEQKGAILAYHVIVAGADGDTIALAHQQYITSLVDIIGFSLDEPAFERAIGGGSANLTKTLKTLDKSQKEFFAVSLTNLIRSAPKTEMKVKYALGMCNDIGISDDEYFETVKKADMLLKLRQ